MPWSYHAVDAREHCPISRVIPAFLLCVGDTLVRARVPQLATSTWKPGGGIAPEHRRGPGAWNRPNNGYAQPLSPLGVQEGRQSR